MSGLKVTFFVCLGTFLGLLIYANWGHNLSTFSVEMQGLYYTVSHYAGQALHFSTLGAVWFIASMLQSLD